ncbi:COPII coat assembly protein SEC16 [Smittium mucronatum]|uniref:COPII coat assembly protein SEC16 n=1 Tax=Smittium mucronatum TaxID=133383 RepID=A0A1R0GYQ4_9FUNG|nr:COPII coat assembly protein SEC16 [Smittium mucronatum]
MLEDNSKDTSIESKKKLPADDPIPFFQDVDDSKDFFSTILAKDSIENEAPLVSNQTAPSYTPNQGISQLNPKKTLNPDGLNFFDLIGDKNEFEANNSILEDGYSVVPENSTVDSSINANKNVSYTDSVFYSQNSTNYSTQDQNPLGYSLDNFDSQNSALGHSQAISNQINEIYTDPSQYLPFNIIYDENSSQYYDEYTGHYYDADYQQFFNNDTQEWYYYDENNIPIIIPTEPYNEDNFTSDPNFVSNPLRPEYDEFNESLLENSESYNQNLQQDLDLIPNSQIEDPSIVPLKSLEKKDDSFFVNSTTHQDSPVEPSDKDSDLSHLKTPEKSKILIQTKNNSELSTPNLGIFFSGDEDFSLHEEFLEKPIDLIEPSSISPPVSNSQDSNNDSSHNLPEASQEISSDFEKIVSKTGNIQSSNIDSDLHTASNLESSKDTFSLGNTTRLVEEENLFSQVISSNKTQSDDIIDTTSKQMDSLDELEDSNIKKIEKLSDFEDINFSKSEMKSETTKSLNPVLDGENKNPSSPPHQVSENPPIKDPISSPGNAYNDHGISIDAAKSKNQLDIDSLDIESINHNPYAPSEDVGFSSKPSNLDDILIDKQSIAELSANNNALEVTNTPLDHFIDQKSVPKSQIEGMKTSDYSDDLVIENSPDFLSESGPLTSVVLSNEKPNLLADKSYPSGNLNMIVDNPQEDIQVESNDNTDISKILPEPKVDQEQKSEISSNNQDIHISGLSDINEVPSSGNNHNNFPENDSNKHELLSDAHHGVGDISQLNVSSIHSDFKDNHSLNNNPYAKEQDNDIFQNIKNSYPISKKDFLDSKFDQRIVDGYDIQSNPPPKSDQPSMAKGAENNLSNNNEPLPNLENQYSNSLKYEYDHQYQETKDQAENPSNYYDLSLDASSQHHSNPNQEYYQHKENSDNFEIRQYELPNSGYEIGDNGENYADQNQYYNYDAPYYGAQNITQNEDGLYFEQNGDQQAQAGIFNTDGAQYTENGLPTQESVQYYGDGVSTHDNAYYQDLNFENQDYQHYQTTEFDYQNIDQNQKARYINQSSDHYQSSEFINQNAAQFNDQEFSDQHQYVPYSEQQYQGQIYNEFNSVDLSQHQNQHPFTEPNGDYTETFMPPSYENQEQINYHSNDLTMNRNFEFGESNSNDHYGFQDAPFEGDQLLQHNLNPHPIISFGFGGTLVSVFHKINNPDDLNEVSSINIHKISDLIPIQCAALPDIEHLVFDGRLGKDDVSNAISLAYSKCEVGVKEAEVTNSWKLKNKSSGEKLIVNNEPSLKSLKNPGHDIEESLYKKLIWLALETVLGGKNLTEKSEKNPVQMLVTSLKSIGNFNINSVKRASIQNTTQNSVSLPEGDISSNSDFFNQENSKFVIKLEEFLLLGDRYKAVEFAISKNLWTHALIISTCVSPEVWQSTVSKYTLFLAKSIESQIQDDTKITKSQIYALGVQYRLFSGSKNNALLEGEFVDPSLYQSNQTPNIDQNKESQSSEKSWNEVWSDTLSIILANFASGYSSAILDLGNNLRESSNTVAAQLCYVLSSSPSSVFQMDELRTPKWPLIGSPVSVQFSEKGQSNFISSKIRPSHNLVWTRFTELNLMWSEIYEISQISSNVQNLNSVSQNSNLNKAPTKPDLKTPEIPIKRQCIFIPHLQLYKISYALWLIDCGYGELALKYCDATLRILSFEPWSGPMENVRYILIMYLKDLQVRLVESGVPSLPVYDSKLKQNTSDVVNNQALSSKNWLKLSVPKPSLTSIFNAFDSSIDKLIVGSSAGTSENPGWHNGSKPIPPKNGSSNGPKSTISENVYSSKWELGPDKYSIPADLKSSKIVDKSISTGLSQLGATEYRSNLYNKYSGSDILGRTNSSPMLKSASQMSSGTMPETDLYEQNADGGLSIYGSQDNSQNFIPHQGHNPMPGDSGLYNLNNTNYQGRYSLDSDRPTSFAINRNEIGLSGVSDDNGKTLNMKATPNFPKSSTKDIRSKMAMKKISSRSKYAIDPQFDLSSDKKVLPNKINSQQGSLVNLPKAGSLLIFDSQDDLGVNNNLNIPPKSENQNFNSAQATSLSKNNENSSLDDDDFLGFGNKSLKKKNQKIGNANEFEANSNGGSDSRDEKTLNTPSNNTLKQKDPITSESSKPTSRFGLSLLKGLFWYAGGPQGGKSGIQADLGEKNSFVYDPSLKEWVNKADKSDSQSSNNSSSLPPPPRIPPPPSKPADNNRMSPHSENSMESLASSSAPPTILSSTDSLNHQSMHQNYQSSRHPPISQAHVQPPKGYSSIIQNGYHNTRQSNQVTTDIDRDAPIGLGLNQSLHANQMQQVTEGTPESFSSFSSYAVNSPIQGLDDGINFGGIASPSGENGHMRVNSPLTNASISRSGTPVGAPPRPGGRSGAGSRSARNKYVDVFNQTSE